MHPAGAYSCVRTAGSHLRRQIFGRLENHIDIVSMGGNYGFISPESEPKWHAKLNIKPSTEKMKAGNIGNESLVGLRLEHRHRLGTIGEG